VRFLYHPLAGEESVTVEGEAYRHLFRSRRHRKSERVTLSNLRDRMLYEYEIALVGRRDARLSLIAGRQDSATYESGLHLAWCLIDPKAVEKSLPMLNEMGVSRISFLTCARCQRGFEPDFKRLERIVINSCQQCGRNTLLQLEDSMDTATFLRMFPDTAVLDFNAQPLVCQKPPKRVLIGPEGGFDERERALFKKVGIRRFSLATPSVLRSETAACAVAALGVFGR